jgi:predicted MFS family arabinose efflux permease
MPAMPTPTPLPLMRLALALSLGAAVSLGVTRFAYGLLLPPMRDDLGWSYTLAGTMNTVNAVGYLLGALLTPVLMRRLGPSLLFLWGGWLATLLMGVAGFLVEPQALLAQRLLAGVLSAFQFIAGGLLAARLAARDTARGSLLLGLYYGGAGLGIVASALAVPLLLHMAAAQAHAWAWAWWGLALLCALASAFMAWPMRVLDDSPAPVGEVVGASLARSSASPRDMGWLLMGYGLFGAGYIGYMTFSVALLREQGLSALGITTYFTLLGVAVVVAPRVWAGLLDRERGGGAFARLNALLAVAALLPVLAGGWAVALVSGLLFGVGFLSVVASTTAFVRHNLPPALWARGISRFTICFAVGHIVGPVLTGLISDGPGGLARGLVFSAAALALGAGFAWRQRPL